MPNYAQQYQLMFRKRDRTRWTEDEAFPRSLYLAEDLLHTMTRTHGADYEFKLQPVEESLA